MKRFILINLIALAIFSMNLFAQKQIVVQNGTNATIYDASQLGTAINNAAAGSTIYLPGGYTFGDIVLTKKLNIYGAGAFSKSTTFTGVTSISSIDVRNGGSGSIIEGINGINAFYIGYSSKVTDVKFIKCKVPYMNIGRDTTMNIVFKDCIINIHSGATSIEMTEKNLSTFFYNCIFNYCSNFQIINSSFNSRYYNCIFHTRPSNNNLFRELSKNNHFENCIFKNDNNSEILALGTLNVFSNCLFNANQINWGNGNVAENCIINQHKDSVFTSIVTTNNSYSEDNNYHIKATSPGKDYGTDGTDLGIYGTANPFKENSVPIIPYIKAYNTAIKTVDGKLEISVDVESQTK